MFAQILTPTPVIPSTPGWCLMYVREAFGVTRPVYLTAWDSWVGSKTKHMDKYFPAGVAVPLYFAMEGVPAGHVVLRLADGTIFSTTEAEADRPTRHPNLDHLMGVYARAGLPLTYLGWTEDIEDTPVISTTINLLEGIDMNPEQLAALIRTIVHEEVTTALVYSVKDGVTGGNKRGGLYELATNVEDIKRTLTPGIGGVRHAGEAIAAVEEMVKSDG
jgi:hypothetical protein